MIGNLARAVEIKQYGAEEDKVYGRTLIALSRHGKREGTDYVRIVLWGRMALNAARYLGKGSRVGIVGHFDSEFYERKKGAGTGLDTEVVVDQMKYLSPPPRPGEPAGTRDGKDGKR